jgi:hypothetical protein
MASIKLKGDTSGELTISAPAVAGTNTLTLPASTGTLAITADAYTDSDALSLLNASGSAPVYAARAWANFSGTDGTINASGNVSSITDNGTGDFTANYTTALSDANYSLSYSGFQAGSTGAELLRSDSTITSSSVNIKIRPPGATGLTDCDIFTFVVIR